MFQADAEAVINELRSTCIMSEVLQAETPQLSHGAVLGGSVTQRALWLGGITLAWKLAECAISSYAAFTAHSPAILAFGSDSLVEVISAGVVVSQWSPRLRVSEQKAARLAGSLLFVLAFFVLAAAIAAFAFHLKPAESRSGVIITAASLLVMPILARKKRQEAHRIHNAALAADAVQSATCAYLALLALLGLALNAVFHIAWFDDLAALLAVPVLFKEARTAWRGHFCAHC